MHHILDEVDAIQQIGEVGRVEQDGPVAHAALLLHVAHALAEELVILLGLGLGFLQLDLRLVDLDGIVVDDRLSIADLLGEQLKLLLIEQGLIQCGILLVLQIVDLRLHGVHLAGQVTLFLFHLVDLFLRNGTGKGNCGKGQCAGQTESCRPAGQTAMDGQFQNDHSFIKR